MVGPGHAGDLLLASRGDTSEALAQARELLETERLSPVPNDLSAHAYMASGTGRERSGSCDCCTAVIG